MKNIEEALEYLSKYGDPRLTSIKGGWHARIEMWVKSEGAEFTIKSDFDHKTPMAAIQELIKRMGKVLEDLGKKRTVKLIT